MIYVGCAASTLSLCAFVILATLAPATGIAGGGTPRDSFTADAYARRSFAQSAGTSGDEYSDRLLHFAWSAAPAVVGTQLAWVLARDEGPSWVPWAAGVAVGLLPGLAKELYDSRQPNNHFSAGDFAWDAVGALSGATLTWMLNLALESDNQ